MIDPALLKKIRARTPVFTEKVCRGFAYFQLQHATRDVVNWIKTTTEFFPDKLEFVGCKRATPIEQFRETTRLYGSVRSADISRHDYYMIKLYFKYDGHQFPPFSVLMPFAREGNFFVHRDTVYSISSALEDVGYQVTRDAIFIPFKRARYNFLRISHNVMVDGRLTLTHLYYSHIHHEAKRNAEKKTLLKGNRPYIYTTLSHYLFCKWGFAGSIKRFSNVDVTVGYLSDIDRRKYPISKYIYFNSATWVRSQLPGHDLTVIVPRDQVNDFIYTMVGSFFYAYDAFPAEFTRLGDMEVLDFWRLLLGRVIKGDYENRGTVLGNMDDHMLSTDTQLDAITRDNLRESGVLVNDIYGLFYEIMTSLSHHLLKTSSNETSMYNKRLSVSNFVLRDFNEAITRFAHELQGAKEKNMSERDIEDILKRTFSLNVCVRSLSKHGEINAASIAGDNMILNNTTNLVDQSVAGASNQKRNKSSFIKSPAHLLDASIAEVGSYTNLQKKCPDGRRSINTFVKIGERGMIERREERRELIDNTQRMLRARGASTSSYSNTGNIFTRSLERDDEIENDVAWKDYLSRISSN